MFQVAQVLAQLKKFEESKSVRLCERNERLFGRKERGENDRERPLTTVDTRERPLTATWDIHYIF